MSFLRKIHFFIKEVNKHLELSRNYVMHGKLDQFIMDISMCFGNNCPIKDDCKRFAGKTVQRYQWYSDFKGSFIEGKYVCDSFIELIRRDGEEPFKSKNYE